MNIYQIEQEFLEIERELEENDGELTPELEEKINITQESFTTKVKAYTDVIKTLKSNIDSIKAEKDRLSALQKSKENTIDSLTKILTFAIDKFGDKNKSGNGYVDFGTGKVTVRPSSVVDIDKGLIERTNLSILNFLTWCKDSKVQYEDVTMEDIVKYINEPTAAEELDQIEVTELTEKDLDYLKVSFSVDTDVKDLIRTEAGYKLYQAITEYNVKVTTTANKTSIKKEAESDSHYVPTYAKILPNKTLTIK